jgi:hypothetical protein
MYVYQPYYRNITAIYVLYIVSATSGVSCLGWFCVTNTIRLALTVYEQCVRVSTAAVLQAALTAKA